MHALLVTPPSLSSAAVEEYRSELEATGYEVSVYPMFHTPKVECVIYVPGAGKPSMRTIAQSVQDATVPFYRYDSLIIHEADLTVAS